jgi:SnoaL-like domain
MRTLSTVLCAAVLLLAGCVSGPVTATGGEPRLADHEAIEAVLARANMGFEISDVDMFAGAFAPDAVYRLDERGPVFGYDKMVYQGRDDIRTIISSRLEKARNTDPKTLSYDPASLRRFNRNSDDHTVLLDDSTAKHTSTWMVVMHTNVNIHISAIGRYTDTLKKIDGKWLIVERIRTE